MMMMMMMKTLSCCRMTALAILMTALVVQFSTSLSTWSASVFVFIQNGAKAVET